MSATSPQPEAAVDPAQRAAGYERAAAALERSAELADALAAHEHETGHEAAAVYAVEAAITARRAARRGRSLALRVRSDRR